MAIYRGTQKMSQINCAGFAVERAFNGSTLVFAAHDRVKITISNSSSIPLSLYSGNSTGTPLAALNGTSLVSYSGGGTFLVNYNAAGFYLAPVSDAEEQTITVTLQNCRGETTQTLTLSAEEGGTFIIPRYGSAVISVC